MQKRIGPRPPKTDSINSAVSPTDFAKARPREYSEAIAAKANPLQKPMASKGAKHRLYQLGPGPKQFRKGPSKGAAKGKGCQDEVLAKPEGNL